MKIKGSSYGFVLFDSEMKAQLSYKLISSLVNCNGDCPQLQVASHSEKCIVKPTDISLEDMLLCFWDLNDQMSTARIMLEDTFVDFDDYKFRIDEVVGKMLDSTFTVKILSYILPSFESVSTPNKSEDNDVRKQSLQESGNNAFSASRLTTEPLGPALLYIGNLPVSIGVADFGKMFGLSGNGVMALMKPMGRRYGFVLFNSKLRAEIAIERLSELVKAYGGSPKMQIVTQLDKSIAEASEFLFEEAKMFLNVVDKGLLEGRKLLEHALQGVVDQVETVEEVLDQLVDTFFSLRITIYMVQTLCRFRVREQDGPSVEALHTVCRSSDVSFISDDTSG